MAVLVTNQCLTTAANREGHYLKRSLSLFELLLGTSKGLLGYVVRVMSVHWYHPRSGNRPVASTVPITDTGLLVEDTIAVT